MSIPGTNTFNWHSLQDKLDTGAQVQASSGQASDTIVSSMCQTHDGPEEDIVAIEWRDKPEIIFYIYIYERRLYIYIYNLLS